MQIKVVYAKIISKGGCRDGETDRSGPHGRKEAAMPDEKPQLAKVISLEVYRRMKQEQAKLLPALKRRTKQKDNEEYPTTDPQPGSEQESADVNKPTVWDLLKKIAQKKSEE